MMEKTVLIFALFSICSWGANAEISDRLKSDFFHIYKHTAIEARELTDEPVSPDKIKYFLYTKHTQDVNGTEINPENPEELQGGRNKTLVFIIHGWTSSRDSEWYRDLTKAFLNRNDSHEFYVIQVDWSDPANQLYTVSSYNTKDVGNIIGGFIVDLHRNLSIPLENILLIGHSLGGQATGFIGKKVQELTKRKLPRIIALDPAGPFFTTRPDAERLNKTDAEIVEVIHTDGGTFGYKSAIGTIDFFPNGGNSQPGCKRIDLLDISSVTEPVMCDHHRSHEYFVEAVLNPQEFLARKCDSVTKFKTGLCNSAELIPMGDITTKSTGEFYLETNKDKPYSKKSDGNPLGGVLKLLQH